MNTLTKSLKGKGKIVTTLLSFLAIASLLFLISFVSTGPLLATQTSLLVFYNGSSIPTNWTCVSCNPGEPFYQRFLMINNSYSVAGGNNYDSHVGDVSYSLEALNPAFTVASSSSGAAFVSSGSHTHTLFKTISNVSIVPAYSSLKVIKYDFGTPTRIPDGALVLLNATLIPAGWTEATWADTKYLFGENTIGSGGTTSHNHLVTGVLNYSSGTETQNPINSVWLAINPHSHTISGYTVNASNNPKYVTFKLIYAIGDQDIPQHMIGLFNSTTPTNWNDVTSSYYGRLIKVSSTGFSFGGNTTQDHNGTKINSSAGDNGDSVLPSFTGLNLPILAHQHTLNLLFGGGQSIYPRYATVFAGEYLYITPITPPQIQFVNPTPSNGTITGDDFVEINITVTTNMSQSNVSFIKLDWDGSNQTLQPHLPPICTQSGNMWNCLINKTSLVDDFYCYKAYANDTFGTWNSTEQRCITTGFNDVVIYLDSPADGSGTVDINQTFDCHAVSFAPMDNLTLFIWNSTNDLVYTFTAPGSFSYTLNLSDLFTFPAEDLYHWNCLGYDTNANWSWHSNNHTILYQNAFVMVTNETYNADTLESGNEPYYITLYRFDPLTNIVPQFYWDNTLENYTIWSSQNGNYITFRVIRPLDFINPNSENHSFFWSFWYYQGGIPENLNSTNHTQTIYRMILQNNNTGGAVPTLETQCIDEMSLVYINCSITDLIDTWPQTSYGEENRQRSFFFSFNSNNSNYTLFKLPNGVAPFYTNAEFISSAPGYQQRTMTFNNYKLNETQKNQSIYLLDTNSGIYVSFLVVNQMYTPLTDVDIKIEKRIMGQWVNILNGQTDESGIWTAFLDPTNLHRFTFNKSGYAIKTLSIYPTQSSYTVILVVEGTGGTLPPNYMEGINITTYPNDMMLNANQDYNFTMDITSKYWKLDSYGFDLVDDNHTVLASTSDYQENGSIVTVTYSCTNQTYVHMEYFFEINNSGVNFTRSWWVKTEYTGNYSIKYLFTDIQSLVGTSGLNSFTLLLIAFAITLMLVAMLSFVTGLYSPMALMGMITAATWFWWFIGVIPSSINGINGAGIIVPIIITFLFVGYAVYENIR